ncbi:MAG: GTP-dependent dephospho-CoA kinase family protein [Thaumarchaeota archaeon]|nr:GTP-dependent dephospho-CoA kinase family protein [Nitrososphaerota archaeon]
MKGRDYYLTPSVRRRLKKPLGRLLLAPQLRSRAHLLELAEAKLVITVGDRVTDTLHALGRTPDVQIVDGMERRIKRDAPHVPYVRQLLVKNRAGRITHQAMNCIRISVRSRQKPVRVLVEGEEDLLLIPAVIEAPLDSLAYYGQPKVGVILVGVDEEAKGRARKILGQMHRR